VKIFKKVMSAILTTLMVQSVLTTSFAVTTSAYQTTANESTAQTQVQESSGNDVVYSYGYFRYTVSKNEVTITKYTATSATTVSIPYEIKDMPVTSIGSQAFKDCSNLKSIEIPDGVTTIGPYAFERCSSLKSVEIPDGVTSIESQAFRDCKSLESVEIPDSVTNIGYYAFYGCSSLESVEIPDSVTIINPYTFYGCRSLESVEIPNSVTSIASYAFYGCRSLESVEIPDSVTKIGNYAFMNCSDLTNVEIPDSVTSIGYEAFCDCDSLMSVMIPDSVTSIGGYAIGYHIKVYDPEPIDGFIIEGTKGSFAERYANDNEFEFVDISTVEVTGISLNRTTLSLDIGKSATLTATITPYNATNKTVIWTTSNSSVATVSGGKVTAVSTGTVTVTAKSNNGKKATCNVTVTNPTVAVTGITLNKTSATIIKGNSETLTATITPSNATNKTVTWTTSNSSVATVSGGKVTAVSAGTATITAKSNNGKTAICQITVEDVESVDMNKHSMTLGVGQAYTLRPTTTPADAQTTFTWKTSNKNIATVTSLGKVTGRAVGKATITVKTADGKTAVCTVVVKNAPDSISLNKSEITLGVGQMYTLQSTLTPTNTATYQQWTSSDKTIAVVNDKGRVTGKKIGTATITVKTTNGHTAVCKVTVKKAPTGVAVNKTSINVGIEQKYTLKAVLTPTNSATYCTWTSSDTSVATVTSGGVVTGKEVGTATIMVKTSNGKTAECTVKVKKAPDSITLDKTTLTLKVGDTYTLTKTLTPTSSVASYTWLSSDTAVATVNSTGKVTAKKTGTAVIIVATHNGKIAICTVTVK